MGKKDRNQEGAITRFFWAGFSRFWREAWLRLGLCFMLPLLLIVACSSSSGSNLEATRSPLNSADCQVIEHFLGQTCLPQKMERIIALDPLNLEALLALGIEPVAAATFDSELLFPSYLQPEVKNLETVGNIVQPNLEKILRLQPDLIIGEAHLIEPFYDKIAQIAPTIATQENSFSVWPEHLKFLATVVGKESEAETLLNQYQERLQEFTQKIGSDRIQKTTVSVVQIYQDSAWLFTDSRTGNRVLKDIGFPLPPEQKSIKDPGYGVPIGLESVTILDADVMFVSYFPEKNKTVADKYLKSPLWSQLEAVKNQNAYEVGGDYWGSGSIFAANLILDDLFKYLL